MMEISSALVTASASRAGARSSSWPAFWPGACGSPSSCALIIHDRARPVQSFSASGVFRGARGGNHRFSCRHRPHREAAPPDLQLQIQRSVYKQKEEINKTPASEKGVPERYFPLAKPASFLYNIIRKRETAAWPIPTSGAARPCARAATAVILTSSATKPTQATAGNARKASEKKMLHIFRVLGKRRPEYVRPYIEELQQLSETDENRVVRVHCLGAIEATGKQLLL